MEGSRCLSWLFLREEGWNRGSLFALAPDTVQPVSGAFFYLFFLFIRVETGCMPPARGESPAEFGKGFPKKRFMHILSIKRSELRRQGWGTPPACLCHRPSPPCSLFINSIGIFLEGRWTESSFLHIFLVQTCWLFFLLRKNVGYSPTPRQHF